MAEQQEIKFEPIQIRYDGLDAENHKIDLAQFGKSALGISKIMATTAQFVATGNYKKTQRKLDFKVLIGAAENNCITFEAVIQTIENKDAVVALFACGGLVAANIITDIYRLVFKLLWKLFTSSDDTEEAQKELETKLLEVNDQQTVSKLIDTVHKMSDGLLPAAKNATQPINISCNTLQFGDTKKNYFVKLNASDKQAIIDREFEITDLEDHRVIISEIDMKNKTCMVSLQNDLKRRFKARITDPQISQANNDYGTATNSKRAVTITAKKKLDKGVIKEFIISDINLDTRPASE
ncbi:MAG: hypothetical protein KAJ29_06955 [Alphaproteobacteria bacterium]|nr:hypothetical protein [Alphaproteobacteria bacterium]